MSDTHLDHVAGALGDVEADGEGVEVPQDPQRRAPLDVLPG